MIRHSASKRSSPFFDRMLWLVIATFAIVIPIFVSPHAEYVFRLPKELLLRAEAIAVTAWIAIGVIWQRVNLRSLLLDRLTGIALAGCAIAGALCTAFSANRLISFQSMTYVIACILVFWATYIGAEGKTIKSAIFTGAAAGMLNASLAIAQRFEWFNPFEFESWVPQRMRITALIGNPNDVGASLAICLIPVAALGVIRRRPFVIGAASLLFCGVIAADALTAILAVALGLSILILLASRRIGWQTVTTLIVVGLATVIALPPLRARMKAMAAAARARDYDALTSHRIVPFLVALEIFRDHPLVGAGPGTFKWLYLPYRLRVESLHPNLYLKTTENVSEVHSDHLQVLAEEGLLGYGAFLLVIVTLASRTLAMTRKSGEMDERAKFIRLAALPLAVCFVMLSATGFPLELTAVMAPALFFTAILFRWSADARAS